MTDSIQTLIEDFEFLDDWEDRYGYVIELGKALESLPNEHKTDATKVRGCVSQVWMICDTDDSNPPHFTFRGESDAMLRVPVAIYRNPTPMTKKVAPMVPAIR